MEIVPIEEPVPNFNGGYYEILCVKKTVSASEITKAYRKLVMKFHPDRTKGDKAAAEKFKQIQEAYDVLGNKTSREFYDKTGVRPLLDVEVTKNAEAMLSGRILAVVQELCSDSNSITPENLGRLDLMGQVAATLQKDIQNNVQGCNSITKVIAKLKVVIKRLSKKNSNFKLTPVGNQLHSKLKDVQTVLGNSENERKVIQEALVQSKDYDYERDPPPPQPTNPIFQRTGYSFLDMPPPKF